ncbi:MAG TPA: nucleoside monophosphate kinase [Chitinivibrionales bacterium]|nr:nucleoside monophosphate kinase [Chitinivibrionales bacterium]
MISSILILGTSNSGKSPLGDYIQEKFSTPEKRYFHFDFGGQLRRVIDEPGYAGLTKSESEYVESVMKGQLIDKAHLPVARKIFRHFVQAIKLNPRNDMLVLNGFPRSIVQADFLKEINVAVEKVVYLDCPASVALARKKNAEAGKGFEDRGKRQDSEMEIFNKKIASFEYETYPLVEYFGRKKVEILVVKVGENTGPGEMAERIITT